MAKPTEQELLDEKLQWAQTEFMCRFNAEEAKYLLVALAYLISGGDRLQSVWYLLGHNGPETRRRNPTSTNKHRQSVDLGEIMDQTWTLQKIKPAEPQSRASWGQRAACCAFFSARLTSTGRTQGRSRHLARHERASFPFPARAGCCSTSIHAPGRRPSFVPTP